MDAAAGWWWRRPGARRGGAGGVGSGERSAGTSPSSAPVGSKTVSNPAPPAPRPPPPPRRGLSLRKLVDEPAAALDGEFSPGSPAAHVKQLRRSSSASALEPNSFSMFYCEYL
jgi:hypothetical protein